MAKVRRLIHFILNKFGGGSANLDLGNLTIHGQLNVDSTNTVSNLSADMLDGMHLWQIFATDLYIDAFYDKLDDSLIGSAFELIERVLHLKPTATSNVCWINAKRSNNN